MSPVNNGWLAIPFATFQFEICESDVSRPHADPTGGERAAKNRPPMNTRRDITW
jgi:hypothetical protein